MLDVCIAGRGIESYLRQILVLLAVVNVWSVVIITIIISTIRNAAKIILENLLLFYAVYVKYVG
jgi:hypothetical protein